MSKAKHSAKKIYNGFGRITGYQYRGVAIEYNYTNLPRDRYSFLNIRANGDTFKTYIQTLPLVKKAIDDAFNEGRMR